MAGAVSGIAGTLHSPSEARVRSLQARENHLFHCQGSPFRPGCSFGRRTSSNGLRLKTNSLFSMNSFSSLLAYSKWAYAQTAFGGALDYKGWNNPSSLIDDSNIMASKAKSGELSTDESYEGVVVLVIGGGGREHALCYALQRSSSCDAVFCAPGNAGIADSGDATCISDLDIHNSSVVISFCQRWGVGLVVVGPEGPLVAGLVNDLVKAGIPTFGPSSEAAALEGSKDFMKKLCDKYGIPTAKYQTFTNASDAKNYIEKQGAPIVVKADGLASGKGVVVANTLEEAYDAVDSMLVKGSFGSAGSQIIVEEFLEGEEASFFALVDGENALPLASAQDHKRVGEGDTGPNTGGMGAYSPAPILTKELESLVMKSIILPTVKGMEAEGCKFVGVLYAGLIIDSKSGLPKLLEYNVRFGDPECQVLMVRLESDLVQILLAACKGQLSGVTLDWSKESALVVVLASKGYPGDYKRGTIIKNLQEAEVASSKVKIFHAGTALDSHGNMVAMGGRVLGVTAMGSDIAEAQERAYQVVNEVIWPEGFCRRDIGWRAVSRLPVAR
jgi:phosphoribosylamine--glycine ligase